MNHTERDRANRIISGLMGALDTIRREAEQGALRPSYIVGVAQRAMEACDSQRERNRDGYLVVKTN